MDVRIKDFSVVMELGNDGIELEVKDTQRGHRGDLRIGRATIEWCKGRTRKGGGKQVTWDDLITWFESH